MYQEHKINIKINIIKYIYKKKAATKNQIQHYLLSIQTSFPCL
jgi:hypothetical protein